MKIQLNKFLGFHLNEDMKKIIYDTQFANGIKYYNNANFVERMLVKLKLFLADTNNKFYLITKSAFNIIDNIKVNDGFNVALLDGLCQGKKITFLIDDRTMFRYFIYGDEIFAMWIGLKPGSNMLSYTTFKINTKTKDITFPDNQENPFSDERFLFFIRLLVFTEFSKTEIKTLAPNEKTGTKRSGKHINSTNLPVTIVDSTWNITISVSGSFGVIGHIRMQPAGKGRSGIRLVFVKSYIKNGYTRVAKKEIA